MACRLSCCFWLLQNSWKAIISEAKSLAARHAWATFAISANPSEAKVAMIMVLTFAQTTNQSHPFRLLHKLLITTRRIPAAYVSLRRQMIALACSIIQPSAFSQAAMNVCIAFWAAEDFLTSSVIFSHVTCMVSRPKCAWIPLLARPTRRPWRES